MIRMEDIPEHLRPSSIILEIVKELEELKDRVRFVNSKEDEFI